jgi:hypothetical protein
MKQFFNGMATIGQLNPLPPSIDTFTSLPASAWQGVASAFSQTGKNISCALEEFSCAQRESQQTH